MFKDTMQNCAQKNIVFALVFEPKNIVHGVLPSGKQRSKTPHMD
jgi:hypothetical protein